MKKSEMFKFKLHIMEKIEEWFKEISTDLLYFYERDGNKEAYCLSRWCGLSKAKWLRTDCETIDFKLWKYLALKVIYQEKQDDESKLYPSVKISDDYEKEYKDMTKLEEKVKKMEADLLDELIGWGYIINFERNAMTDSKEDGKVRDKEIVEKLEFLKRLNFMKTSMDELIIERKFQCATYRFWKSEILFL